MRGRQPPDRKKIPFERTARRRGRLRHRYELQLRCRGSPGQSLAGRALAGEGETCPFQVDQPETGASIKAFYAGEIGCEVATMVQFRNEDDKGELSPKENLAWAAASHKPLAKVIPRGDNVYRLAALGAVAVGVALVEVELLAGVALGAAAMAAPQFIKALRSSIKQAEKTLGETGSVAPPSANITNLGADEAAVGAAEPTVGGFHKAVTKIVSSAPEGPEELKQKLLQLGSELDRIKDKMPPDALAPLRAEVEKLAHEATNEKRESTLRTSGERILAMLKITAELAAPAAKLIPEILEVVGVL
jgi:hypothetical protein